MKVGGPTTAFRSLGPLVSEGKLYRAMHHRFPIRSKLAITPTYRGPVISAITKKYQVLKYFGISQYNITKP